MANQNRYYKTPFAESGNKAEVPNVSVGGAVGYDSGFGPDYELPQGSPSRKRIERDLYNGMHFGITKNLKQWQEDLYPTWIEDDGTGVAFTYKEGMIVNHAGQDWISNEGANQEEPGTGIKWKAYAPVTSLQELSGLTEPSDLDQVYERCFTNIASMIAYTSHEIGYRYLVDGLEYEVVGSSENNLALGGGLYAQNRNQHGLTVLNTNLSYLSASVNALAQPLNIVITGDSLSLNGFGYPASWAVAGDGYATDQPQGLMSWAHMLRDFVISSNPAFKPINTLKYHTDTTNPIAVSAPTEVAQAYYGMNVKALNFSFTTTSQKLIIENNYVGGNALLIAMNDPTNAIVFDVDGVEYNNESINGHYRNSEYLLINCNSTTTITNVRKKATLAAGGLLSIYGSTSRLTKIPKLTGKGGWTSEQILAEYPTLVAPYTPDVVYYIISANDIGFGRSVAAVKEDIKSFIDKVYLAKPDAIIVLMTTPPTTTYTKDVAIGYIEAMRDLAIENNCSCIDMWSTLENIDPSVYRFDNIHWTAEGDNIVFNIVKDLTLNAIPVSPNKFIPIRNSFIGASAIAMKREGVSYSATWQATVTTPTLLSTSNANFASLVSAVYSGAAGTSKLTITPTKGYVVSGITSLHRNNLDVTESLYAFEYTTTGIDIIYSSYGSGRQEIAGSDKYVQVQFVKDSSLI